jgi:hypothetical protein
VSKNHFGSATTAGGRFPEIILSRNKKLMKEILNPYVLIPLAVLLGMLLVFLGIVVIVLGNRITGVHMSRSEVEIHTNDLSEWRKFVDIVKSIDSKTHKKTRLSTLGLQIIDPKKYGMSTDAALVNRDAVMPLVWATYENNHTRELATGGGDTYLAEKTEDVFEFIKVYCEQFPELTEERSEAFVCRWFKKILIPNVRRQCVEKVNFYKSEIIRKDLSKTTKADIKGYLEKNEDYIKRIDELYRRSDIEEKSTIILKT